jgi:integrase
MKLTEVTIAKISVPPNKRDILTFDDSLPGFGIRKFETGRASFFVKFSIGRQQRKITLGPVVPGVLAEMRRKASDILARARLGEDTQAAKKTAREKKSVTFGELIPRYLAAREGEMSPSYLDATRRYLTNHWEPLHARAIEAVARRDVVAALDEIAAARGKVAADRAVAAIGGLFSWLIDRGYVESTPVLRIRRRANGGGRERCLSEGEIKAIWRAVEGMGDYCHVLRLLILTAQRRSEIADLTWQEIDFERRQIELPAGRTKNRRPHILPLSEAALAVIAEVPRRNSRDFLFGEGERGFQGWSRCKIRLNAKLPAGMAPWTIHDLRRSTITHLNERDFAEPHVIEAVANHVSSSKGGVAGVYNRAAYAQQKRAALDAWGAHVAALVGGVS